MQKKYLQNSSQDLEFQDNIKYQILEKIENYDLEKNIKITSATKIKYLIISINSKVNIDFYLEHENSEIEIFLLTPSKDKINSQINIQVHINSSNSLANVYMLWLLWDNSKTQISGNIILNPQISKSEWYLLQENLILWKEIKIQSVPRLDIHSSDIKASHWLRIHKLDEEKLFYMQSRWLSIQESTHLITKSYIESVLQNFTEFSEEELQKIQKEILDYLI